MKTHNGPSSYTQITTGSPPTGGDALQASDMDLKHMYVVLGVGLSDDGQYRVEAVWNGGIGSAATSVLLMWIVAATGAQVTGAVNLSARSVRLLALGQ